MSSPRDPYCRGSTACYKVKGRCAHKKQIGHKLIEIVKSSSPRKQYDPERWKKNMAPGFLNITPQFER